VIDHYMLNTAIDKDRIGISGISMGGTLTLLTSYSDKRIRAGASFLSIMGYDSLPGLEKSAYLPAEKLEEIHSIDPLFAIKKMPEAAVLAQFGQLDEITERPVLTDFENKLRTYYSGSPERFRLVREPQVRHDLNMEMIRNSVEWFKKFL
jgi:dienelactone hydrolase